MPLFGNHFGVAADASRLQGGNLDVAAGGDRTRRILVLQRIESGANHVVGIRRADRLRDHILDAERFEYRAHRAAGDDAGAGRRGAQIDAARAMTPGDVVMQRAAFAQRDPGQVALRRFGRLANRFRHLTRLAVAEPDPALLVADHHQRREAEALAALHHLRHTVDVDELVHELAVTLFPPASVAATAFAFTCHGAFQS